MEAPQNNKFNPVAPGGNPGSSNQSSHNDKGRSMASRVVPTLASKVVVLLVVLASLAVLAALAVGLFSSRVTTDSMVKSDQYQVVFLSNGQVYFGKLSDLDRPYVALTDIYYLQVEQQIQPEQGQQAQNQQQPKISLAKLGNELHGPEDAMYIERNQVVFWENLKDEGESKVVQAIKEYQRTGGNSSQNNTQGQDQTQNQNTNQNTVPQNTNQNQ